MKRETVAFDTHASCATSRSVAVAGRSATDGAASCSFRVGRAAFAISIAELFSVPIIPAGSLGKHMSETVRDAAYFDESFVAHFMM